MSSWWKEAACYGKPTGEFVMELFSKSQLDANRAAIARAKAVCARCPVSSECLADALEHGGIGIWGGTTDRERTQLRKPTSLCGTDAGYRTHLRLNEVCCRECHLAHNEANRKQAERARKRRAPVFI